MAVLSSNANFPRSAAVTFLQKPRYFDRSGESPERSNSWDDMERKLIMLNMSESCSVKK